MQQRLMLGLIGLGIVAGLTGCAEKAVPPSPMESAVRTDKQISETILDRYKKDVSLSDDIDSFQVMTVKGEATVYGVVDSELERSHAEQMVVDTKGVKGVTSRIKLVTEAAPVQTASTAAPR